MSRRSKRNQPPIEDSNIERLKGSFNSIHGHRGNPTWISPYLVSKCTEASRADQGNTIESSEYLDNKDVLNEKLDLFIELLKKANCCTAYTGAGLSRSAGIGDYASKKNSINSNIPKLKSCYDALPTLSHRVLVALERNGYLHHYVQQNHDGLPQKAGFPQEKINEIHGAWYDPSNPVVQFNENLRSDFYKWMIEMEKKTDLCLCLGTSLSGMNADRIAETPAIKSLNSRNKNTLGTIIINLQQTRLDSKCCLRIWAKLDDTFQLLADKLNLSLTPININPPIEMKDQYIIPYNKYGLYDTNSQMLWDLRPNSKIIVCNPDASNYKKTGKVFKKDKQQNYVVHLGRISYKFGKWWPQLAMEGRWPFHLPFINIDPIIHKKEPEIIDLVDDNDNMDIDNDNNDTKSIDNTIILIQTHKLLSNDSHEWSIYFNNTSNIQSITYNLHPTFKPSIIKIDKEPFLLQRIGWGIFSIKIQIELKNGKLITYKHSLSFDNDISQNSIIF